MPNCPFVDPINHRHCCPPRRRPEFAACGLPYTGGLNDNKLPVPDVPGIDSAPSEDEAAISPSPPAAQPPAIAAAPVPAPQLPGVCTQALFVLGLVNSSQSLQVRTEMDQQCQQQRAGLAFGGRAVGAAAAVWQDPSTCACSRLLSCVLPSFLQTRRCWSTSTAPPALETRLPSVACPRM